MTPVGETLRRERLKRNLDLDTIARETKISSRFLDAIETEQFDKLPGGVFARSFVKQYARVLELDEDELMDALDRTLLPGPAPIPTVEAPAPPETPESKPEARIAVPRMEEWVAAGMGESKIKWSSTLPAILGVILVMLACSFVYGWWQKSRQAAAPVSAPAAQAPAPSAPAVRPPETPAPSAAREEAPLTNVAAQPAMPPPAQAGAANAAVNLQITAHEPAWVLVRTDGKFQFAGILAANETRTIQAADNVQLRVGNAGGVDILYNGKPVGPLGPKGQVRTLQFTSGGFQPVPAAPAAPRPDSPTDPL